LLTETEGTTTDRYFYDEIGNRTGVDKGNNGSYDVTYTYNSGKRMQLDNYSENGITWAFTYDKNGNMTGKSSGTTSWTYRYNAYNQLIEVVNNGKAIGQYEYDSNGLRIKKIENGKTTYYIYNGQSILFEETYSSLAAIEKREYNVELSGMNLAKFVWDSVNGWKLNYHLLDHLGSRQVVRDSNGTILNNGKYGTFGQYKGGSIEEALYTGKKFDSVIGFYYFNARYYSPELGRFVTIDPIKSGTCWYVYCGNNPLKFVDKNGLEITVANNKDEKFFLDAINQHSYVQFTCDKNNKVVPNFVVKPNDNGSKYYSDRIIQAIDSDKNITLYKTNEVRTEKVEKESVDKRGGGVTGRIYDSNNNVVRADVILSGNPSTIVGMDGNKKNYSVADIVLHELLGHAIPNILGENCNATNEENIARYEIGYSILSSDPNHTSQ